MEDRRKTKDQLVKDIAKLGRRIEKLEASEKRLKEAEDALHKSEKRYHHIIEDQTDLICRFVPEGILTFVNDAYCRYFGKTRKALIGSSFLSLVPEADRAIVENNLASLTRENPVMTREHRVVLPGGTTGWQQWVDRAIFNKAGVFIEYQSVGRDITDRKRMEEKLRKSYDMLELRIKARTAELVQKNEQLIREITERQQVQQMLEESENKYRTLFETTGTAMIIVEEDMCITLANSEMEQLSGYTKEELEGKKYITNFIIDEDVTWMAHHHSAQRIDESSVPQKDELRFTDRHGIVKDIFLTVSMIPGTKRTVISFMDVTDYKHIYKSIEESERKYRILTENVSDIIWTTDMDLRYTYVSPSIERILGYTAEEVTGKTAELILTADSYGAARKILEKELALEASGQGAPSRSRMLELEHMAKDGSPVWTELTMIFLRDSHGRPVNIVGVTRDISERARTEETLKRREMELELKSRYLEEANTALKVLLKHREDDKIELQGTVLSNVKELIMPYIDKLKTSRSTADHLAYLNILETNLLNIISPFLRNMTLNQFNLTPKEIQVANLIKDGRTTKEIARLSNLSVRAIEFHRENIRKKLGLRNKKANLRSYLLSLS